MPVPEAAVNEHCQTARGQNKVWGSWEELRLADELQSCSPEQVGNLLLGLGSFPANESHPSRRLWRSFVGFFSWAFRHGLRWCSDGWAIVTYNR